MPHLRTKALRWDVLQRQMPRGGWACLDLTDALCSHLCSRTLTNPLAGNATYFIIYSVYAR
jgi:hypothetical protein